MGNNARRHCRYVCGQEYIQYGTFQRRLHQLIVRPLQVGYQPDQGLFATTLPAIQQVIPPIEIIGYLNDLPDQLIKMNEIKGISVSFILRVIVLLYFFIDYVEYLLDFFDIL